MYAGCNPIQARWTRIGEPIGKGGFGTVWRVCESSSSANEAALKVVDVPALLRSGVDSVQLQKDLLREVGLMATLSHIKGVTGLLEAFIESSGVVHLVMELCRGPSLQWVLDGRGALSELEAKDVMRQLLEAVSHLHAQLVEKRPQHLRAVFYCPYTVCMRLPLQPVRRRPSLQYTLQYIPAGPGSQPSAARKAPRLRLPPTGMRS